MVTPRQKFEDQLRRLEDEKAEYARDMRELERLVEKYELVVIASPAVESEPTEKKVFRTVLAAKRAEGIIRASGHPVQSAELFKILTIDRDLELGGTYPPNALTNALATSRKLQFLKDYGWWLRGVPWPMTAEELASLKAGTLDNESVEAAPKKVGPKQTPEKKALFEGIRSLLRDRAEPMAFAELFDRLADAGLSVGGTNERKNLAVFLSKYSCFMNEGRKRGWRYVPERDFELQSGNLFAGMTGPPTSE